MEHTFELARYGDSSPDGHVYTRAQALEIAECAKQERLCHKFTEITTGEDRGVILAHLYLNTSIGREQRMCLWCGKKETVYNREKHNPHCHGHYMAPEKADTVTIVMSSAKEREAAIEEMGEDDIDYDELRTTSKLPAIVAHELYEVKAFRDAQWERYGLITLWIAPLDEILDPEHNLLGALEEARLDGEIEYWETKHFCPTSGEKDE